MTARLIASIICDYPGCDQVGPGSARNALVALARQAALNAGWSVFKTGKPERALDLCPKHTASQAAR